MKKQVFFLEWGIPKENYASYYDFLESREYDIYEEKFQSYKCFLWERLGEDYEYHIVPFPNRKYADYHAWKIVFEKIIPFMRDDCIFVATSLGASFVAKYLSENTINIKIEKLIMLAPAFYDTPYEKLWSFLPDNWKFENIQSQCDDIVFYHSIDDEIVLFSDSEHYLKLFPHARFRKFTDKGHFYKQERIIELEEDILNNNCNTLKKS